VGNSVKPLFGWENASDALHQPNIRRPAFAGNKRPDSPGICNWRKVIMSKQAIRKPLSIALGVAVVTSLGLAGVASASTSEADIFSMEELTNGYLTAGGHETKDEGEGTCGEDKSGGEGNCGEDKDKKEGEGKCGEGKCGGDS
jgi:uncharacterized low-complexity protein